MTRKFEVQLDEHEIFRYTWHVEADTLGEAVDKALLGDGEFPLVNFVRSGDEERIVHAAFSVPPEKPTMKELVERLAPADLSVRACLFCGSTDIRKGVPPYLPPLCRNCGAVLITVHPATGEQYNRWERPSLLSIVEECLGPLPTLSDYRIGKGTVAEFFDAAATAAEPKRKEV